jgi:putative membrane protein insertion efficiency factor
VSAAGGAGGSRGEPAGAPARARRPRLRLVLLALLLLAVADLARAPAEQLSARVLLAAIDAYQGGMSRPLARAGVRCRFQPTCSRYAEGAIRADGALVGSLRAGWRILRCGPWTPAGTVDPP